MLESHIEGSIFRHIFKGEINARQLIDARVFVKNNAVAGMRYGVLWDFREAVLSLPDEKYMALTTGIVDKQAELYKRAFLVANDRHQSRVEKVLGRSTVPWPWAVFQNEGLALEWLEFD